MRGGGGGAKYKTDLFTPFRLPLEIRNHDGSHLVKKRKVVSDSFKLKAKS